jgi:hypothetical protein
MHISIIIDNIKLEISKNKDKIKNPLELEHANKNTIKNYFEKYSNIIYIF